MNADPIAFPDLEPTQLATLRHYGDIVDMEVGSVLFAAGDVSYDFFVVIEGGVDIVANFDGTEQLINHHGPGRFLGELNLLTGQRVFLSARVAEPSRILTIPAERFRRLVNSEPTVSDTILNAFIARRAMLMNDATDAVRVIGSRYSPQSMQIREFLARNQVPHHWMDVETDQEVDLLLRDFNIAPTDLPVVLVGRQVLRRPSPGDVSSYLGLTIESIP